MARLPVRCTRNIRNIPTQADWELRSGETSGYEDEMSGMEDEVSGFEYPCCYLFFLGPTMKAIDRKTAASTNFSGVPGLGIKRSHFSDL